MENPRYTNFQQFLRKQRGQQGGGDLRNFNSLYDNKRNESDILKDMKQTLRLGDKTGKAQIRRNQGSVFNYDFDPTQRSYKQFSHMSNHSVNLLIDTKNSVKYQMQHDDTLSSKKTLGEGLTNVAGYLNSTKTNAEKHIKHQPNGSIDFNQNNEYNNLEQS